MKKITLLAVVVILVGMVCDCAGSEEVDSAPPVISEISVSDITATSATITWTTDEPATSEVEYGLTTSYGSTATSPLDAFVTNHSLSLRELEHSTTYHYRVKSEDESVNEAVSGDYTFTTTKFFPDDNLEAAVREVIGRPEGPIEAPDLEALTLLNASGREIANLTGLEHCMNLTNLDLSDNQITDISPLENLAALTSLRLNNNQIVDISPLADLTSLAYLNLNANQIVDISLLADFTSMDYLGLAGNQISDFTPLQNLTSLTKLVLTANQLGDITFLQNLTSLTHLSLGVNQISDITPLKNLTSLTILGLASNQVVDITPLVDNEGLGEGDTVDLSGNPLSTESINTLIPQLVARGVTVQYVAP